LLLHLAYLEIIVEILENSDLACWTPFLFKKTITLITGVVGMQFNPGSMKVWENIMSTYPAEIRFIHQISPSVSFLPWKCIQSLFCPGYFYTNPINENAHNVFGGFQFMNG
jgi:hypothetical protein